MAAVFLAADHLVRAYVIGDFIDGNQRVALVFHDPALSVNNLRKRNKNKKTSSNAVLQLGLAGGAQFDRPELWSLKRVLD